MSVFKRPARLDQIFEAGDLITTIEVEFTQEKGVGFILDDVESFIRDMRAKFQTQNSDLSYSDQNFFESSVSLTYRILVLLFLIYAQTLP